MRGGALPILPCFGRIINLISAPCGERHLSTSYFVAANSVNEEEEEEEGAPLRLHRNDLRPEQRHHHRGLARVVVADQSVFGCQKLMQHRSAANEGREGGQ